MNRKFAVSAVLVVLVAALGLTAVGALGVVSNALKSAQQKTATAEKGTSVRPDATPRKAAKGKLVCIVTTEDTILESSKIPSDAAAKAAKAIGWNVCNGGKPYDGGNNPSKYPGLIRDAIAAGADGIILDAIDCDTVRAPLDEAKKQGIVVVPIYAFDCNDPKSSTKSASDFTTCVNYGGRPCNKLADFTRGYGADQANYIIAKSNNKAKILELQDPEYIVLDYTSEGFNRTIKASGGSKVTDVLKFTSSEVTGDLKQRVQNELLKHPDINWVKIPYAAATTFGQVGAAAHALHRNVMGGEGFKDELDLIKSGVLTAANAIDSQWTGWAAVDAMNSAFNHQKSKPSGIGWVLVDKQHNHLSPQGFTAIPYQNVFKKAWGK